MPGDRRKRWPSWLAQLLGPEEPQLGCDECLALLDQYVDLEVTGADARTAMPRLEAHLRGCKACREEHDDLFALVSRTSFEAPPETGHDGEP